LKSKDVSQEHFASIFGVEEKIKQETSSACYLFHAGSLLDLFFDPEDGGDMFLRKVG
jgi:hypothetical protein